MSKRSLAIATMAMTLFGALAPVSVAQAPLPGIPMCPVDHPALALQPRLGGDSGSSPSPNQPSPNQPMDCGSGAQPEPETTGVKRSGKDLKKAVAAVGKLQWHDKLGEARVRAAAAGKPILFIQALGDLEGFA